MKYWNIYITCVKRNCINPGNENGLAYWRDNLFATTIIYLLPFCLIALLPGLFWIFATGQYMIAIVDVLTVTGITVIAFVPGISQAVRKIIFISCIYLFSCALLYFVGLPGPGLLYLLTCCIFSIIIFQTDYRFWSAWLNVFVCFLFALAISFHIIPPAQSHEHLLGEWIAISTNLIFVSFLSAALIPNLFYGLQESLNKEKELKSDLNIQQQSLQRKNDELEQFAYVTSHDLKEPLRMVISFLNLLKNKYGDQLDEKAHIYIKVALDGGNRMQRMISDLLELSLTARHDKLKEIAGMDDILNEVKQNIFKLIEETNAEIILKTALPVLAIYRTDMISLLQNLLSNAIKFGKKGISPVISISAIEKQSVWLFIVEDNGIGIEKEKFEKIFEIFARLHAQVSYEGSGIGLAICKKIAERNGGEIWLESEEGKGSTFYFTIKK